MILVRLPGWPLKTIVVLISFVIVQLFLVHSSIAEEDINFQNFIGRKLGVQATKVKVEDIAKTFYGCFGKVSIRKGMLLEENGIDFNLKVTDTSDTMVNVTFDMSYIKLGFFSDYKIQLLFLFAKGRFEAADLTTTMRGSLTFHKYRCLAEIKDLSLPLIQFKEDENLICKYCRFIPAPADIKEKITVKLKLTIAKALRRIVYKRIHNTKLHQLFQCL